MRYYGSYAPGYVGLLTRHSGFDSTVSVGNDRDSLTGEGVWQRGGEPPWSWSCVAVLVGWSCVGPAARESPRPVLILLLRPWRGGYLRNSRNRQPKLFVRCRTSSPFPGFCLVGAISFVSCGSSLSAQLTVVSGASSSSVLSSPPLPWPRLPRRQVALSDAPLLHRRPPCPCRCLRARCRRPSRRCCLRSRRRRFCGRCRVIMIGDRVRLPFVVHESRRWRRQVRLRPLHRLYVS